MVYGPTYPRSTYTIWFTSWTFLFLCEQNLSLKIAIRCQIDDQHQGQLPKPTQTFELMREKDHIFHLHRSLTACSNGVKRSHPEFKELLVEFTGVKVIISHRLLLTAKTILVPSFSIFDHHVYHWLSLILNSLQLCNNLNLSVCHSKFCHSIIGRFSAIDLGTCEKW